MSFTLIPNLAAIGHLWMPPSDRVVSWAPLKSYLLCILEQLLRDRIMLEVPLPKLIVFIAPGAQGTIFEGTISQILVQRVQFCQIVPF